MLPTKNNLNKGQSCIVTKGLIELFDYQSSQTPIIVFHIDNTKVTVDDKTRKIVIIQHGEKSIKMTLDCTSAPEFARWKFALTFGGFLKCDINTNTALREFIFPIKIFDTIDDNGGRSAFDVQGDRILLYINPNSNEPFLIWDKSTINITTFDTDRRVRIHVKKNTKYEERFDLIIPLLNEYNNFIGLLNRSNYSTNQNVKNSPSKYKFIISKPGNISMHSNKYDKEPLITLQLQDYISDINVNELLIKFKPKVSDKRDVILQFKKEASFKKWLLAIKIAGFVPISKDNIPVLYFPTIMYGFTCLESKRLFKNYTF